MTESPLPIRTVITCVAWLVGEVTASTCNGSAVAAGHIVFVIVGVKVRVGVATVGVGLGVLVREAVGVMDGVFVGPVVGSLPHVRDPLTYAGRLGQSV